MERVKCICEHLGVKNGELGTVIDSKNVDEFEILVKWDNGIKETVQLDIVEFLDSTDNEEEKNEMEIVYKLKNLKTGTKILLTNGQVAEFVEMKRVKFTGIIDGKKYRIPATWFVKVLDTSEENQSNDKDDFDSIVEKEQPIRQDSKDKEKVLRSLKPGDYFYMNYTIRRRKCALLFKFKEIKNNKVIGINQATREENKIDMTFDFYKL